MPFDGSLKFDTEINNSGVKSGLNNIVSLVKGAALGYTGKKLMDYLIGSNADMQQYLTSFEVMLGSAEKAKALVTDLQNMANVTPFETSDLTEASKTMMAFGEDVKNLKGDLSMLGDISLGNAEKLKSLSLVFGQIQSAGKLTGQDLLQLVNVGFNPLQVISEKTGESMEDLRQKMSDGKISFEMVRDAMKSATSQGGLFYQAMEKQSKTMSGMISTLKDYVAQAGRDIGEDAFQQLENSLSGLMMELEKAKANGSYDEFVKNVGGAITTVGKIVIEVAKGLGTTAKIAYEWKEAILVAAAAMAAFKAGAVLTPVIAGFQEAKLALALLTAQSGAAAVSQTALAGGLSLSELAVGVLTGKIKLATAAQTVWNGVMEANPIGLVLAAVTALGAGIAYMVNDMNKATKAVDDYHDSMKQVQETAEQNIKNSDAEAALIKQKAEIYEELRKKVNRTAEEEETLRSVAEDLQAVLPDGTRLIDEQTGAYLALGTSIDNVIAKMKAQALVEGAEAQFKAAVTAEEGLRKSLSDAQNLVDNPTSNKWGLAGIFSAKENLKKAQEALDDNLKIQDEFKGKLESFNSDVAEIDKKAAEEQATIQKKKLNELEVAYTAGNYTQEEYNKKKAEITGKEIKTEKSAAKEVNETFKSRQEAAEKNYRLGITTESQYYAELNGLLGKYADGQTGAYYDYYVDLHNYQESSQKQALTSQKSAYTEAEKTQKAALAAMTEAQEKSFDNWKDGVNAMADEYSSAMDKIVSARDALENKLASYGDPYKMVTGEDGKETMQLNSLSQAAEQLKKYEDRLKSLRSMGASGDFMTEFMGMDIDEAVKFYDTVNASTGGFEEYLTEWQKNRDEAKRIAEEYYAGEIETLQTSFIDKMNAAMAQMPQNMELVGEDAVQGFIDGLNSKLATLQEVAAKIGQTVIDASRKSLDSHSPSRKMIALGHDTADGYTIGLQDKAAELQTAIEAMLQTPDGAELGRKLQTSVSLEMADTARNVAAKTTVINNTASSAGNVINIDASTEINSPKALSRAEIMREENQRQQQLVRQVANLVRK